MGGSAKETWIDTGWTDILTDDGHRVVTPDLLGHGSAERPHDPDAYAHLRQGAQDAVGDEKPLVGVGFSLGARVLVEWALAEPDRFSKLALLGMGDNLFAAWDPTPMISALEGTASIDHPFVERLLELTSRNGGDPLAGAAMLRYRGRSPGASHLPGGSRRGDRCAGRAGGRSTSDGRRGRRPFRLSRPEDGDLADGI